MHSYSNESFIHLSLSVESEYETKLFFDGEKAVARKFNAADVRQISSHTGFFNEQELRGSSDNITVPFGTWAENYIAVNAARKGFETNAIYSAGILVPAPRGLSKLDIWNRNFENGLCSRMRNLPYEEKAHHEKCRS